MNDIKLKNLENLYCELIEIVKYSLSTKIEKEYIEKIVLKVIDAFIDEQFNSLLLYSYSFSKDTYIYTHIANDVVLSIGFGVNLGLNKTDLIDIGICSFCHDFGMAEYANIVQQTHELSAVDNKMIEEHPMKSAEIFNGIFSEKIIKGILDVHEYVNGGGYPKKSSDLEISYLAKIISICDVFEALTHPRNFRQDFNPYEAIKMIISKKDIIFNGTVVKKFLNFMSIYPIGSLVCLNSGEIAIVTGSNSGYPTRSVVKVLLTPKREVDSSNKIINLLEDTMLYISGMVSKSEEKEILNVLKPRGSFNL